MECSKTYEIRNVDTGKLEYSSEDYNETLKRYSDFIDSGKGSYQFAYVLKSNK